MPFFYRASHVPDVDFEPLVNSIQTKGKTADSVPDMARPHTSHGTPARITATDAPPMPWFSRGHRLSMSMSRSRSSTFLPLGKTTPGPIRHHRLRSRSAAALPLDTSATAISSEDVGIALGSPTDLFHHRSDDTITAVASQTAEEPRPQTRASTEPQEKLARPNLKRWRTVSGLFTKRQTHSPVPSPLGRVSEESQKSNAKHGKRESISRSSSYFSRKSRESTPSQRTVPSHRGRSGVMTPTPGDARAFEAGIDKSLPLLSTAIPSASFERFSVMFSNLLAPRPGHTVTVEDLAPTASPSCESQPCAEGQIPSQPPVFSTESQFPLRSQSLAPQGTRFRASAVPAPLFASKAQQERPTLRAQSHAITESLPEEVEAWALCMSPDDPVFDHYSRRCSFDSYATSALPSPAFTASSWCTSSTIREGPSSPPISITKFPPPPRFGADLSPRSEQLLAVPSPGKRASWDDSLPSPMFAPHSSSPRMKFGYDAPHSPLISVAQTVTVSVKSGQGQRPHFVVHDDGHSRHASYAGSVG